MANKTETEKTYGTATFVLDNGLLIECSYPDEIGDEFWAEMRLAARSGDLFNVDQWEGVDAKFQGFILNHINMARVVGIS